MNTEWITQNYKREDFINFLSDFLPDDFENNSEEVYYNFTNMEEGFRLGTCQSLELDIFEFSTKSNRDPRVTLTREVVSCMKKYSYAPNALVVFYSTDSHSWRFSLITTDYTAEKGKVKTEHSNPRRFSFKFGTDCKRHKPEQMLFKKGKICERTENGKIISAVEDLKSRFALEVVSKQFFDEYKVFYEDFVQYITGNRYVKSGGKYERKSVSKENTKIFNQFKKLSNGDYELACKYVRDYVKKFMGRLVFLQFLQKKGWLGVDYNSSWGNGNKNFLLDLFASSKYKTDFLEKVLEPLFFGMLNTDVNDRKNLFKTKSWDLYLLKDFKQIPYLNGGLFEDDSLDDLEIRFPQEMFSNPAKADKERTFNDKKDYTKEPYPFTESCGLLDFFARYNFTIDETDPADMEIGVDPEMLGKIFENLLEDNKDKGAFYTPKEIVQYMCRESLITYLGENSRQLVINHTADYTASEKSALLEKLRNVKVCDPAVGSGAFPMGMLNELFACRVALGETADGEPVEPAEIKKYIVRENIYGVDIEKGAVDIARLRFWLAIIVDEKEPIPLPNLDYKIMQGNSLLESFEGQDLSSLTKRSNSLFDNEEIIKQLTDAIDGFYIPSDHIAKAKIRNQISEKVIQLLKERQLSPATIKKLENLDLHANCEFFLWHTWFGYVFNRPNDCNGFDIVIGNPPYIKEYTNKAAFDGFREQSPYYIGKMDLWYGFACHGIDLLRPHGVLCFIAQNNWTTSSGAKLMRKKVINDSKIRQMLDFNTYMVFENADIQTMIMLFEKDKNTDSYTFDYRTLLSESQKEDMLSLLEKVQTQKTKYLSPKIVRSNYTDKLLTFSDNDTIFEKIAEEKEYLTDAEATNGIHTHHDNVSNKIHREFPDLAVGKAIFVLNQQDLKELKLSTKEESLIKPFFTSEEIFRYYTNNKNSLWIIYTDSSFKNKNSMDLFPNIKKHLDFVGKAITSDNRPYGLQRAREEHFFKGEKIVSLRKCVDRPCFSYSNFDCYVPAMYYVIQTSRWNMKFLTGILNSKLIAFWLKNKGKMQGDNYQVDKEPLLNIPLPTPSSIDQTTEDKINDLVDKILTSKQANITADTTALEYKIDELVYALYGLTAEEITIIEGNKK
ncbi:MAG: N-6 DNA methylase [Treponema sp.]|nr:N-6 DNA methylase [Treponema sp.]